MAAGERDALRESGERRSAVRGRGAEHLADENSLPRNSLDSARKRNEVVGRDASSRPTVCLNVWRRDDKGSRTYRTFCGSITEGRTSDSRMKSNLVLSPKPMAERRASDAPSHPDEYRLLLGRYSHGTFR